MPEPIAIRPFTWSDAPLLAGLRAGLAHGAGAGEAQVAHARRWLRQPNLLPEREGFFALEDGLPVGAGYLVVEQALGRGVLLLDVPQAHGEAEEALVVHARTLARSLGLTALQVDVAEGATPRRTLLERQGFTHVRTHWHLRREGDAPAAVELEPGQSVRLAGREDVPALTALQNAAFTGSWGYAPNTQEEIAYRVFEAPDEAPDPVLLLEQDGQLLAYCWAHVEVAGGTGFVGMVGTVPNAQGQGLGRVVTAAAVDHLVGMGAVPVDITVDSENARAVRLYQRLGFLLAWRSLWYQRAP
ncbi:MAG: GNAT family N-acetyltransferase [Chloroflexota bacterium]